MKSIKKIVVFVIVLHVCNSAGALKPDTIYSWKPDAMGLMYKEYDVKTSDGYTLKAWFCPAQTALSDDSIKYYSQLNSMREYKYKPDTVKKPTIIICNGDGGNMQQLVGFAAVYCWFGFNVMTFDWRGFGESQAFPVDTNVVAYPEFILDYDAVVDFTKQLPTVDSDRMGVFGFSTGAFMSFYIAAKRPEIKAMVGRGIFTCYADIIENLKKINPTRPLIIPETMDDYSPKNNWHDFKKPVFLIVGDLDERTPKENSIEILQNVKSNVRELWIVDKAGHGGWEAPEIIDRYLFIKKTVQFFQENL